MTSNAQTNTGQVYTYICRHSCLSKCFHNCMPQRAMLKICDTSKITCHINYFHVVPPNITSVFPEMHLNATQSLSISCSAEGTAPLRWVWLLNGNTLSSTPSHSFTTEGSTSTLTIPSLEEENGGVFQCQVDQPTTGRSTAHHQWVEVRGQL